MSACPTCGTERTGIHRAWRRAGVGLPALPLTLTEADFQQTVLDFAKRRHWRAVHIRQAQRQSGHWAVPYEGDPGLPDLILARDGRVILAELKRHGKNPTPQQAAWLTALGEHGRLWRPDDWIEIQEELW